MRRRRSAERPRVVLLLLALALTAGCAKYNTYFNAKRAFDRAEIVREDAIRQHKDPGVPSGAQRADYETAVQKAQKILDEYPGHSLTDDALFLQGKALHRLDSYRMSIRKFDLLFTNFPATDYLEEALYLQALNYLLLGGVERSQEYLDQLGRRFPESRFQAETRKVSGDNAYTLEDWAAAAESYEAYLERDVDRDERDRIALKLAECYWELARFAEADRLLAGLADEAESAELAFRARLLRARVKTRLGQHDDADQLIAAAREDASIYKAQGEVALADAENMVDSGRGDAAVPLLQNMPAEWVTPAVKARAADILGRLHMERGEWEQARAQFQTALTQKDELEDPDLTRRLEQNLKDYLVAEQSLPDAGAEQVPRLKLLQANAMLFGFDRPAVAADLYRAAAADTAADSTLAARALYGAYLTYERHLARPDSAAIYAQRLVERFPSSPQAFEIESGGGTDLVDYLLARRSEAQRVNLAALSDEEREALTRLGERTTGGGRGPAAGAHGFRRRMIYLSRRDNLVYQPPEEALQQQAERSRAASAAAAPTPDDGASSLPMFPAERAGETPEVAPRGLATGDTTGTAKPALGAAPADSLADAAGDTTTQQQDAEQEEKKEEKKEPEEDWDFLR